MMKAEEKTILIIQQEYFPFCVLSFYGEVASVGIVYLLTGDKIISSGERFSSQPLIFFHTTV